MGEGTWALRDERLQWGHSWSRAQHGHSMGTGLRREGIFGARTLGTWGRRKVGRRWSAGTTGSWVPCLSCFGPTCFNTCTWTFSGGPPPALESSLCQPAHRQVLAPAKVTGSGGPCDPAHFMRVHSGNILDLLERSTWSYKGHWAQRLEGGLQSPQMGRQHHDHASLLFTWRPWELGPR